jgi:hypothetical protein
VNVTVVITGEANSQEIFQPDSRSPGVYFSEPGDTNTLEADGSATYDPEGEATSFLNADGQPINYNY